jgi:hypothetical protein
MRYIIIIIILTIWSCGTNSKNEQTTKETEKDFELLIKNLTRLETGYTYDLVMQDAQGCYIPDKNADSLFYNPALPILGILSDNNEIFSIIHLEPGEDFHPTLRTFDKSGQLIDEEFIDYSYCSGAQDCNFIDCSEVMRIISKDTIEDVVKLVTAPCDNSGNKIMEQSKSEVKTKIITIDKKGQINSIEKN